MVGMETEETRDKKQLILHLIIIMLLVIVIGALRKGLAFPLVYLLFFTTSFLYYGVFSHRVFIEARGIYRKLITSFLTVTSFLIAASASSIIIVSIVGQIFSYYLILFTVLTFMVLPEDIIGMN